MVQWLHVCYQRLCVNVIDLYTILHSTHAHDYQTNTGSIRYSALQDLV